MKFVTEYRDSEQAKGIAAELAATVDPNREYRFMEFCGGHTHVLARWGLTPAIRQSLINQIHGFGDIGFRIFLQVIQCHIDGRSEGRVFYRFNNTHFVFLPTEMDSASFLPFLFFAQKIPYC